VTTAMALLHFVRCRCKAAVLEVGLGGRLDSTNVCMPRVAVITSISYDHTDQLGPTLSSIAREKAGIVKPGVPLVSGVEHPEARGVIAEVCRLQGAPLMELGTDFTFEYRPPQSLEQFDLPARLDFRWLKPRTGDDAPAEYIDLALPLVGRHQAANAALALAALARLRQSGWRIDEEAVRRGLASLRWPGRCEVVQRRPTVVLDVAHNVASIEALLATLDQTFRAVRWHLLFAVSKDKDVSGMLEPLLARFDTVALTRYLGNPRGMAPESLAELARDISGRCYPWFANPPLAWKAVVSSANPDDLICVTGSFFIAAEIRQLLLVE